jgi:hypothetical protein
MTDAEQNLQRYDATFTQDGKDSRARIDRSLRLVVNGVLYGIDSRC